MHLVEPAFEHGDADHAVRRRLLRQIGVAEIEAELALQVASDRRCGIDEILVAAAFAREWLGQCRQRGAQRRRRALVHAVRRHVDRQLVARLAELARHGSIGNGGRSRRARQRALLQFLGLRHRTWRRCIERRRRGHRRHRGRRGRRRRRLAARGDRDKEQRCAGEAAPQPKRRTQGAPRQRGPVFGRCSTRSVTCRDFLAHPY